MYIFFLLHLQHCSTQLQVRVGILVTCRKCLQDIINSLREEVWAHETSLTLSLFTEVSVPSQECERTCYVYVCISTVHM